MINKFKVLNPNETQWHKYIDLHFQYKKYALLIVGKIIYFTLADLQRDRIKPNHHHGKLKNHILKIICGFGKHSKGFPVLKHAVREYLVIITFNIITFRILMAMRITQILKLV